MSPRSSHTEKEAKRVAIVAAAATVFARQGFIRTRMADIAIEAQVGKGTLYEYFTSKDELFFAVFDDLHKITIESLRNDIELGGNAPETLKRLFTSAASLIRRQAEQQAVVLDFWAVSRGQLLEQKFREASVASYSVYRDMAALILENGQKAGEIRRDIDTEALAVMLVAAFDGLGVQLFFDPNLPVEHIAETLVNSLCLGILEKGRLNP